MVNTRVQVKSAAGLHLRPAGFLAETGMKYTCNIHYGHMGKRVNGKSLLSILSLGVKKDCILEIECDGADEEAAMEAILAELNRHHILEE